VRVTPEQARRTLDEAELVCDAATVSEAIRRMAAEITAALADRNPLILVVMRGGIYVAGQILPLLRFPLELDYVDLSRYGDATTGGILVWKAEPSLSVEGRAILVLDDILDVGHTLVAVRERLIARGAASVHLAVLTDKLIGKPKPIAADFVGLKLPNRYVFGCGMDVSGAWRNLPAIYALKGS
jgi:hypoxanthine phosphoribosyltransferase